MMEEPTEMEKEEILELIYNNSYDILRKSPLIINKNLNWNWEHHKTQLDDYISPIIEAAFLGKVEIAQLLLENPSVDINAISEDNAFSPLTASLVAGHYEMVKLLIEEGADVNYSNPRGQTPFVYCFSRLDEDENMFENKNLCIKMGELLLQHGADINTLVDRKRGYTILMQFCSVAMQMDPFQTEMILEVIRFLLEHGADREIPCKNHNKSAYQLAENHLACEEIRDLLDNVKQLYFHPNMKPITQTQDSQGKRKGTILDDSKISCGCCSLLSFYTK